MAKRISDEIRNWCDDAYSGRKIRTTKDLYALADRIDSEMVDLPKECEAIDCWDGSKHVAYHPSGITRNRPDSLERIADELDEMVDAADSADDNCEKLADLAERIRMLAEKEGE